MTLSDLERLMEIFSNMKHRTVSLRHLNSCSHLETTLHTRQTLRTPREEIRVFSATAARYTLLTWRATIIHWKLLTSLH